MGKRKLRKSLVRGSNIQRPLHLGADSHSESFSPAACSWGLSTESFLFFSMESFLFFPLNQSGFGNINIGIKTNLSMWERDVRAVLVEHLDSSYSKRALSGLKMLLPFFLYPY